MKKLGKKQMGGSTKTKSPSVDRSLASKIKTESSSLAKKEAPEYKKTSTKTVSRDSVKSPIRYQNGGATSDIKSGAKQIARGVKKGVDSTVKTAKSAAKTAVKATPQYQAYKAAGKAMKSVDDSLEKRYPNYTGKGSFYDGAKQAVKTVMGYKTGGMVNSNASVQASKVAKGRPAKSAEPKSAAKKATGRVGGISKSPKTATPKMKMGGSMKGKKC